MRAHVGLPPEQIGILPEVRGVRTGGVPLSPKPEAKPGQRSRDIASDLKDRRSEKLREVPVPRIHPETLPQIDHAPPATMGPVARVRTPVPIPTVPPILRKPVTKLLSEENLRELRVAGGKPAFTPLEEALIIAERERVLVPPPPVPRPRPVRRPVPVVRPPTIVPPPLKIRAPVVIVPPVIQTPLAQEQAKARARAPARPSPVFVKPPSVRELRAAGGIAAAMGIPFSSFTLGG